MPPQRRQAAAIQRQQFTEALSTFDRIISARQPDSDERKRYEEEIL
jgi:uncharacterized DUF497 family protein